MSYLQIGQERDEQNAAAAMAPMPAPPPLVPASQLVPVALQKGPQGVASAASIDIEALLRRVRKDTWDTWRKIATGAGALLVAWLVWRELRRSREPSPAPEPERERNWGSYRQRQHDFWKRGGLR